MNKKDGGKRQKNFQIYLHDDEWERFLEICDLARSRLNQPDLLLKKSFIIRRLVGLEPPDELVTQNDIDYFLGRKTSHRRTIRFLPPTEIDFTDSEESIVENSGLEDSINLSKC